MAVLSIEDGTAVLQQFNANDYLSRFEATLGQKAGRSTNTRLRESDRPILLILLACREAGRGRPNAQEIGYYLKVEWRQADRAIRRLRAHHLMPTSQAQIS